ncbi:hypothetical protein L835_4496 [Mycobacteroides abscessus MAB_110811_1470]|nr:hypothetical protein L835_4496 [Mycobacteroides abscessus MAB_110811_1470]
MKFTSAVLSGVVGAGAVASALAFAGAADAAPSKCTAAEFARTHSTVSSQVASYLDKNPTINDGITNAAKGAPEGQRREAIKTYLDGQPAAKAELEKIRQPLTSLKNSCGADTDDAAPAAPAGLMGQAPAAEQPAVENAPRRAAAAAVEPLRAAAAGPGDGNRQYPAGGPERRRGG